LSCSSEDKNISEVGRKKTVFDVTANTLKAMNELSKAFEDAERLLNNTDSLNDSTNKTSISPEYINSLKFETKDTIRYSEDVTLNDIVNTELKGKVQIYGNPEEVENFMEYLGKIVIDKKEFYVISKFSTIQLAISKRGRSSVLFLDMNKEVVKNYDLEMPNCLPVSIKNNQLIFNVKGIEHSLSIDKELSIMLCLPSNLGCYEAY
jgi:hypothetical protein